MGQEYELPGCEGLISIQVWHWQSLLLCYQQETQKMTIKACQINANTESLTAALPVFLLLLVWIARRSNSSWRTDKQHHHIVASKNIPHIWSKRSSTTSTCSTELKSKGLQWQRCSTVPVENKTQENSHCSQGGRAPHSGSSPWAIMPTQWKGFQGHDCSELW